LRERNKSIQVINNEDMGDDDEEYLTKSMEFKINTDREINSYLGPEKPL